MKILGINISHDTSVAGVTDGHIDFVHDEARFRRAKYWDPGKMTEDDNGLLCIERHNLRDNDHVIYASFDRRVLEFEFDKEKLVFDRLKAEEFCKDVSAMQLTRHRLDSLQEKYKDEGFIYKEKDNGDEEIIARLDDQLGIDQHVFMPEHHLYHAECVYNLSPWKDEECIAIVWDGGGCQPYWDTHPGFQEMETIYHCVPGKEPKKVWQRLSNSRMLSELGWEWPNHTFDCLWCYEDQVQEKDGIELVFSSKPSSGMNFSHMSLAFGCDEEGRAAGKVMGMASYGRTSPNVFNQYSVAQKCEEEALTNSLNIINKAKELIPNTNKILLSGGYSLNCTNNYKYLEANPDYEFFVDPIPHDGGTALGACIWLQRNLEEDAK